MHILGNPKVSGIQEILPGVLEKRMLLVTDEEPICVERFSNDVTNSPSQKVKSEPKLFAE